MKRMLKGKCESITELGKRLGITDDEVREHIRLFELDGYAVRITEKNVCSSEGVMKLRAALERMMEK